MNEEHNTLGASTLFGNSYYISSVSLRDSLFPVIITRKLSMDDSEIAVIDIDANLRNKAIFSPLANNKSNLGTEAIQLFSIDTHV